MHRRVPSLRHGMPVPYAGMPHAMGNLQIPSLGPTPNMSLFPWLVDSLHPRKFRLRATLLCLLSLMSITTYICLISPPAHSFERRHHHPPHWRNLAAQFPLPPPGPPPRPDVLLSPEQELGALTAFMAALPQNVIPSNIDPLRPIDPQLVLDFDTRSPEAVDEIDDVVLGVWMNNPVVLFTKVWRDPQCSSSPLTFRLIIAAPFGRQPRGQGHFEGPGSEATANYIRRRPTRSVFQAYFSPCCG
jgi:hypothetical protein